MYFAKTPAIAKRLLKEITWSIPSKEKSIYLTFDDGPTPEITEWTLETLKKYNAKATFFCIGKNIERHPEIFKKIIAEGHSIGNHTYDHLNGWKTDTKTYLGNIDTCQKTINFHLPASNAPADPSSEVKTKEEILTQADFHLPSSNLPLPAKLFRPPYGKILKSQISHLKSQYSIILWDVLSGDFDPEISKKKCFDNVVKNARAGSIVVFHDSVKAGKNLTYALPEVLEYFWGRGYGFKAL